MMKLSEAIRLGSMLHPQGFEELRSYQYDDLGAVIGMKTCALGAAQAAGYWLDDICITRLQCPACATVEWLDNLIPHLNDDHRWTREAIADWVETLELRKEIRETAVKETNAPTDLVLQPLLA